MSTRNEVAAALRTILRLSVKALVDDLKQTEDAFTAGEDNVAISYLLDAEERAQDLRAAMRLFTNARRRE